MAKEFTSASQRDDELKQTVLFTPFPLTLNHAWLTNGKRRYRTKTYLDFEQKIGKIVGGKLLRKGRYRVSVFLFPNNRRLYDADNRIKCLLDALTRSGIWDDDSQVNQIHIYKGEVIEGDAQAVVEIACLPKSKWFIPAKFFGFVAKIFKKSKRQKEEDEYDWDE